jgi:small subunit ribosomal protein S3
LGHKVHPTGFRIGVILDWQARWYADEHYAESLQEDLRLRQAIQSRYADAAVSLVEIERQAKEVSVTIHTARPGIVIGRGGQRVDELSSSLEKLIGKKVRLNIQEIRQPELDANLVAKTIAEQIQRRIAYRRAIKQAIFRTIQAGAKGIRVSCSGRLGDAEIARRQTMHEGQVPLHTLRADIDYGFTEARTTLGRIGVKVWIYKGEILPEHKVEAEEVPPELAVSRGAEEIELAVADEAIATETAEAAPAVTPEEKPAKPAVKRRARKPLEPIAAEPAETAPEEKPAKPAVKRRARKPLEPVAAEPAETAPEEKPAKPAVKRRIKAAVTAEEAEKPTEPIAVEPAEVAPEEKPAKPAVRRRARKPLEPMAAEPAEAAPEEKSTKPAARKSKKKATEADTSTLTEKERNDATT